MSHFVRIMAYGVLNWLVTFGISLLFAGPDGFVHGDYAVFRTVMFAASTFMAALLLASHFRHIKRNFLKEGILVGVVWLELNVALDFLTVVPRSGMGVVDYITGIGVDYVGIPVLAVLMGHFLERGRPRKRRMKWLKRLRAELRQVRRGAAREAMVTPRPLPAGTGNVVPFPKAARPADRHVRVRPKPTTARPAEDTQRHHIPSRLAVPPPPRLALQPLPRAATEDMLAALAEANLSFAQRLAEIGHQTSPAEKAKRARF